MSGKRSFGKAVFVLAFYYKTTKRGWISGSIRLYMHQVKGRPSFRVHSLYRSVGQSTHFLFYSLGTEMQSKWLGQGHAKSL